MNVTIDSAFEWLDFFCGAGGSTTGLITAGATVRLAADRTLLARRVGKVHGRTNRELQGVLL